ncbi:MAG: hypothetical protein JNM94_03940 [Phycisphaerae bacterium]|nr:hypothetical protein [Phycisphaerae bacterium]
MPTLEPTPAPTVARVRTSPRRLSVRSAFALLVAAALTSVGVAQESTDGGAAAPDATQEKAPSPPVDTRLKIDPEAPEPVEGWWTNGAQLLELTPEGMYRLFATQNRFEKPLEVGRWVRQNYATLWLEPYSARKEARTRIVLTKEGSSTQVTVRKFAPMVRIDAPPLVEEDFVIGLWLGQGGTLELKPSLRYRYVVPAKSGDERPVVIASHQGSWRLKDGRVELTPDSPSIARSLFEPTRDDTGRPYMRLRGIEGTLDRVIETVEKPAATPSSGAAAPATPSDAAPAAPATPSTPGSAPPTR